MIKYLYVAQIHEDLTGWFTGLQTGCLAERRQKEVWGGGGVQHMPGPADSLPTFPIISPAGFLFFLSKKAECFLGAQSGWVLVKPVCAWAICCRGKSEGIHVCVRVCV